MVVSRFFSEVSIISLRVAEVFPGMRTGTVLRDRLFPFLPAISVRRPLLYTLLHRQFSAYVNLPRHRRGDQGSPILFYFLNALANSGNESVYFGSLLENNKIDMFLFA